MFTISLTYIPHIRFEKQCRDGKYRPCVTAPSAQQDGLELLAPQCRFHCIRYF